MGTETNLMSASKQWATRPDDERFDSLEALETFTGRIKATSVVGTAKIGSLHAEADEGELYIVGASGQRAIPTNFAAKQLLSRLGYSSADLDKINAEIASDIINYRIDQLKGETTEKEVKLLLNSNDSSVRTVRSITSDKYGRFWNVDAIQLLKFAAENGWKVPPARPALASQRGTRVATEADCLSKNEFWGDIKPGDIIAPAGLYASDRNMFAVMVNTDQKVDDGTGRMLSRGMFLENSEVGDGSLSITEYLFANVCGNHIIWDAKDIIQVNYRHVGDKIYERIGREFEKVKRNILEWSPTDRQSEFARLREFEIATDKEAVVEAIYGMRIDNLLTKRILEESHEFATVYGEIDGANANTPLGMVGGLTRYTQTLGNGDKRFALERAGGKILAKFASLATS